MLGCRAMATIHEEHAHIAAAFGILPSEIHIP